MRNVSVNKTPIFLPEGRLPQERAALVFLALSWIVSGLGAASPLATSVPAKLLLLVPPFLITVVLTLHRPADGFTLWSLAIGFMVTQTGYQLAIDDARLSALEVVILFLLLFLVWYRRRAQGAGPPVFRLPGLRLLLLFVLYAFLMLGVSLLRGVRPLATIIEFKGFVLYPFVPFIMVVGLRSLKIVRAAIAMVVGWYLLVATQGIGQFRSADLVDRWGGLYRASADYASINTYGITLLAAALLVLGIGVYSSTVRARVLLFGASLWLFMGAVTSVSRTVWVAAAAGLLILLTNRDKRHYGLILLIVGMAIFLLLPNEVAGRIDQLSDSSTQKRELYLQAGMQAWQQRWLTGWGWGVSFYMTSAGLIPGYDGIAWYHNDYLILASQTGLIGLLLYVGYWLHTMVTSIRWRAMAVDSPFVGYVRGAQMALVGLLAAAFFEHVLWKPDIAGLVGWVSGLMFTCMYLDREAGAWYDRTARRGQGWQV
jgi:hypothetical protein